MAVRSPDFQQFPGASCLLGNHDAIHPRHPLRAQPLSLRAENRPHGRWGPLELEYRLLGPVEAWWDGMPVRLGGPKPRALLAVLLLRAGQVVPADALVDAIWGEEPPDTARALVQSYVSALRRALPEKAGEAIETRSPGY